MRVTFCVVFLSFGVYLCESVGRSKDCRGLMKGKELWDCKWEIYASRAAAIQVFDQEV